MMTTDKNDTNTPAHDLRSALETIRDMKPHHAGQTANEYHMQEIARRALASDTIGNGGGGAVDEYEALIAAGFDEYAARCALRTEGDGGFCHAYFYSDGLWRFQTGGNDLTIGGNAVRCVLTKRLFAHPPAAEPVGLRELTADDLAKAINPSLFSDDPLIRHQAASPYDVAASQQMALNKARGILARLQSPATPARTDDTAQALVKAAQPEIDSVGSHAGNGGDFDPYARVGGDRNDIAYAIIKGSAGERAAWHAMEFQTGNWSDALRSADAVLTYVGSRE